MKGRTLAVVLCWFVVGTMLLSSCKSRTKQNEQPTDTRTSGKIIVSADESFKPIIDAQVQVFESNHPDAHVVVHYKAEAECLKDMFVDSVRMIIATRGPSRDEYLFVADSFKTEAASMTIARDGIAVIVNPRSEDSLFSMRDIREMLTGRFKKKLIPVFDGVKATSTVRYIVDSVLINDSLGANVKAAKSSEEVIDYVANNPDAVGFIGVSWIGNRDDQDQLSFLKRVKIAWLESKDQPGQYILPVQANLYPMGYPMVRDLVYILKENHNGLAHGFADFMSGEIGQLIFKRGYLMPAQKNFVVRPIRLRQ